MGESITIQCLNGVVAQPEWRRVKSLGTLIPQGLNALEGIESRYSHTKILQVLYTL